jgi:hypothetical protein
MTKKLTDMIEPIGWVFFSADFSCVPEFKGSVMFRRDKANTQKWHKLSDEEKETTPLYVKAHARTLIEAIERACRIAEVMPPVGEGEQ